MNELRERLERDFASAFIRIRGAHNPKDGTGNPELQGWGEPCEWCRLAAEQAAEAVLTTPILSVLRATDTAPGLDVAYREALPVLRRVFDGASWFPSGWMSFGRRVKNGPAQVVGMDATREEHAAIARLVWSVESDGWDAREYGTPAAPPRPRVDEQTHRDYYRQTILDAARYLRDHGMSDWPIVLERDLDKFVPADGTPAAPDSLSEAWAEAEAALPDGWRVCTLMLDVDDCRWIATAETVAPGDEAIDAYGPTPAAALHALTARLREQREAAKEPTDER